MQSILTKFNLTTPDGVTVAPLFGGGGDKNASCNLLNGKISTEIEARIFDVLFLTPRSIKICPKETPLFGQACSCEERSRRSWMPGAPY